MPAAKISRRRFLHGCTLAGTVLVVGSALSPLFPLSPGLSSAAPVSSSDDVSPVKPVSGKLYQETQLLMGTFVTISALCPSPARAEEALGRAWAEMNRLIAVFDRFDRGTALGVLNSQGSLADAPPELLTVLTQSERFARLTEDAFNPAIAPLVDIYRASKTGAPLPDAKAVAEAMVLSQPGGVRRSGSGMRLTRSGMRLTLDGIAKGYIADAASTVLTQNGVINHLVNAGGDIRVSGVNDKGRAWTVGIENPLADGGLEPIQVSSGGIATSGGSQSFYDKARKHHHIMSHRTGQSPSILSITVKAPSTAEADALATALALLPPAQALQVVHQNTQASCLILTPQARYVSYGWG